MIFILVISILSIDQLAKYLITHKFSLHQSLPIIKGVFHLTLVFNRGAAFGILINQAPIFIFTSVLAIILIYSHLRKTEYQKISLYTVSLALILGGALGNLIDRLRFSYVIDFLDLRIWPVFNVADSAITIGAILLGYSILKKGKINPNNYQ